MAFPPVPFQEWFLRQTSTGNAALNAYVARVKADGGVVEAIGCVPLGVWDWAAPSFVGLLDLYPNAAAAYSLRKLRAAYSGAAVRVRRSSNNTEQDIAFDANGDLDTASLLSFVNEDVIQYTSDFSSTEDLSEFNGTGAAAQSVGGVNDAYKFTLTGAGGLAQKIGVLSANTFNVSLDYYIPSTNTYADGILIRTNQIGDGSYQQSVTDAWTSVSIQDWDILTGTTLRIYPTDGGSITTAANNDVFYLKNIVITQTTADGFVTVWYDQSLSNDATQTTAANQPKIVSAGSLVTENGKAAVDFDGVDDYFIGATKITMDNTAIFSVIKSDSNTQDSVFIQNSVDLSNFVALGLGSLGTSNAIGSRLSVGGSTVDSVGDSTFTATDQTLVSYIADNTAGQMFVDGTEETDAVDCRSGGAATTIGAKGDGTNAFNGAMQEVIFFASDQSANRTPIETNINNFYSIYP